MARAKWQRIKKEVFEHYSKGTSKCVCCGFDNITALTIDDIEGRKMGSEMQINKNFSLKIAYDNKDLNTLSDEWYSKLAFIYPGTEGPTALDGKSDTPWK